MLMYAFFPFLMHHALKLIKKIWRKAIWLETL